MSDAPPAWPPFYEHGGWFRLDSDEWQGGLVRATGSLTLTRTRPAFPNVTQT
jgi:hypothetical protein